jgi:hypothetical protein
MSENTDPRDPTPGEADELQRLREHNRQLIAELKAARQEAKGAREAAETAQGAEKQWRDRWYQAAVAEPLEAELRGAAALPWKYLRDVAIEAKLLAMETDAEGIERPVWRDEQGRKADLSRGLHAFLLDVHRRTQHPELGRSVRALDNSGGGAPGGTRVAPTSNEAQPAGSPPAPTSSQPAYGLR